MFAEVTYNVFLQATKNIDLKIAVIDNYDSFTYNLVHYIEQIIGNRPTVYRNDLSDIQILDSFDCLVLSPGPGLPQQAGRLMEIIELYYTTKPILGVCLGHQALGLHFGGTLKNLPIVFHGESVAMNLIGEPILYKSLIDPIYIGRYHSWVINNNTLHQDLKITGVDEELEIMSFEHEQLPIVGIQYHPESILTPNGLAILRNFFDLYVQPYLKVKD